ncbi:MAG: hypothetical protein KF812_06275 [Fimbriimonadaceae bacterium]|nr:hypothetical protein [Fimbriimonadaceae bacterium]
MRTRTFGYFASAALAFALFLATACTPSAETTTTTSVPSNQEPSPAAEPAQPNSNSSTENSSSNQPMEVAPVPAEIPELDKRLVGTYKIVVTEEAKQMMRDGLKAIEADARAKGISEAEVQAQVNNLRTQMTAALEATRLMVTPMGTFTIEINGQSRSGTFSVDGNTISFVQAGEPSMNIDPAFTLEFNPDKQTLTGTQDGKQMVFAKV